MPLNILIADGGSTKTEWSLLSPMGSRRIMTQGISPYFMDAGTITALLQNELMPEIGGAGDVVEVFYYGTGCTAPTMNAIVQAALSPLFPSAQIHIDYDLSAAAHALCDRRPGIACILGTGSNSCYYDGVQIVSNSPGLGYILGDEGSGAHLGKKIVTQYLYGKLSPSLTRAFELRFSTNKNALLQDVYSVELPNRFLASFSLFFSEHLDNGEVRALLKEGLNDFFKIHISAFPECHSVPVHFTGSIAWVYRELISELCFEQKMKPGKIIKEPMQDLIAYHRENIKYL